MAGQPSAFDRLVAFVEEQPASAVGKPVSADHPEIAPLLALAEAGDARLHKLMTTMIERKTSFWIFDVELYPEMFLRGRKGEKWNADGAVIGERDIPIAKNGAGDVYVWNAERGDVRLLDHERSFETRDEHASLDDFVEAVMESAVESAAVDQLEANDDAYAARLRFAIDVAGDESLDDEVRAALIERGLLEG